MSVKHEAPPGRAVAASPVPDASEPASAGELRLFLEEICCELVRVHHVERDRLTPESVETIREVRLGSPGLFADIRVAPAAQAPYFVEVKWGYDADETVERLARKYATNPDRGCRRLVVVTDHADGAARTVLDAALRQRLCPTLAVEIWGEAEVCRRIEESFGLHIAALSRGNIRAIRDSIVRAEWRAAFAGADDYLAPTLLWHFSSWSLRRLGRDRSPQDVLRAGIYRGVAVVMADICAFSSYVRDTRDEALVRQSLTAFYSQARQAIVETGGMLDKFVGDEAIGLFGFPDHRSGYADDALRCARRLIDIGNSVSEHWQSRIDRVQKSRGVHIGIAMGDVSLMPLRAFSTAHHGFIGDALNMTARLMAAAGPSDVLVSNSFYQALSGESRKGFRPIDPVDGRNVGLIQCWQLQRPEGR
ncbi:adenylate/guanylate cyclase domain-containing protein [Vineibacter terrae]|uniref:adenylate/guanylate cyclase domain-containing protein n=1 Tax=Vineibacter terrae TaxID=2586908 RepID=UPI002E37F542|nr:adenylate/guanylate cyclase domain-containing protein [Vineibacter terrae]HEX2885494.1 adenylate/guanylate cyclase domain-containing protein [Vineibacter terrae]